MYCRIEEIQEIPVLEESSQPQPRTAVPQATPKGEHKVLAPLPRPRPLKPQDDDDDISRYSRVQIIDTSFQIQKAEESKIVAGIVTLSVQDLDDPECLAAYLATVCGLPEEDCLVALRECETQLLAIRAEFEQSLANDAEGTADVFTDDKSSLISRILRWKPSVERPESLRAPPISRNSQEHRLDNSFGYQLPKYVDPFEVELQLNPFIWSTPPHVPNMQSLRQMGSDLRRSDLVSILMASSVLHHRKEPQIRQKSSNHFNTAMALQHRPQTSSQVQPFAKTTRYTGCAEPWNSCVD